MKPYQRELLNDAALIVLVFVHWIAAAAIADACSPGLVAKRVVSVWISAFTLGVNAYSLVRSASFLGKPNAPKESIPGLFFEIVNITQVWGALFASARYFSLPGEHAFYAQTMLRSVSESIFEMSLVQAGVGWASEAPVTFLERIVAWMAAYIGGVLCTNLFLLSVVLGRRGRWEHPLEEAAPASASARVPLMIRLK